MNDWNVVVTVHERNMKEAQHCLDEYGRVARTEYFNVVVMQVAFLHSPFCRPSTPARDVADRAGSGCAG
jgi:hypothetical protein